MFFYTAYLIFRYECSTYRSKQQEKVITTFIEIKTRYFILKYINTIICIQIILYRQKAICNL